MKKYFLYIIATLLISITLLYAIGCNKKVASYNPDFLGTWRSTIVIDSTNNTLRYNEIIIEERDGLFRYYCSSLCEDTPCNCTSEQTGRAVVSTDKKSLRIGSNGTVLSIDKEPYQDSGQWKMKLQGLTYVKQ